MLLDSILKIILLILELASACTGFFLWQKWKNNYWRWFPFFLMFIFCSEILAKYFYAHDDLKHYNPALYRYFNIPITIFFYFWILGKPLNFKNKLNTQMFFLIGYVIVFLLEQFLFPQIFRKFGSFSFQFGAIGILVLSIQYFMLLIKSDTILNFKYDIHFWVSAGLIIYFITTLPLNAMRNVMFQRYHDVAMPYWKITFLFNYIMYVFFILGFIWGKVKS